MDLNQPRYLHIEGLLSGEEVELIRQITATANFKDGKVSAKLVDKVEAVRAHKDKERQHHDGPHEGDRRDAARDTGKERHDQASGDTEAHLDKQKQEDRARLSGQEVGAHCAECLAPGELMGVHRRHHEHRNF